MYKVNRNANVNYLNISIGCDYIPEREHKD